MCPREVQGDRVPEGVSHWLSAAPSGELALLIACARVSIRGPAWGGTHTAIRPRGCNRGCYSTE